MVDYHPHWHCVWFTNDGVEALAYYNGHFESREVWNAFLHEGGLAVYKRALSGKRMATLAGNLRHAQAVVLHPDTVRRVPPHA